MNGDLQLAAHERAARARFSAAAGNLRAALAPARLVRRAIRARPWAAVAVAGTGGLMIGSWLGKRPLTQAVPADAARPRRDWVRVLTQASQVVGALAAAKAAHAHQATAAEPADV